MQQLRVRNGCFGCSALQVWLYLFKQVRLFYDSVFEFTTVTTGSSTGEPYLVSGHGVGGRIEVTLCKDKKMGVAQAEDCLALKRFQL